MPSKPHYPKPVAAFFGNRSALQPLIDQGKKLNELLEIVRSHLPDPLKTHCLAVTSGTTGLILYTDSSAWASRLRFFSRQLQGLLEKAGMASGRIAVRVLIRPTARQRPARKLRTLSQTNARLLEQLAEDIGDEQLSAALRRLSRHGS